MNRSSIRRVYYNISQTAFLPHGQDIHDFRSYLAIYDEVLRSLHFISVRYSDIIFWKFCTMYFRSAQIPTCTWLKYHLKSLLYRAASKKLIFQNLRSVPEAGWGCLRVIFVCAIFWPVRPGGGNFYADIFSNKVGFYYFYVTRTDIILAN